MIVGYVASSNNDYSLELQVETLKKYGCNRIFHSRNSTTETKNIQVLRVLDLLKSRDIFVVCKLKNIADSITQLLQITNYIREKGIMFVSIQEQLDTRMPTGKITFKTLEMLDEFSRNLIHERKVASLKTGRPRGRNGGRPKVNQQKLNEAISLYFSQTMTVVQIQEATGISRTTLYRSLNKIKK
ncbi:recombinase family protein [Priestia megaterium]|uniref:recombinase family protein n=1 Tax=Priestia megaterium TaxID=1404 RepID=UPI002FFEFDC2